MQIVIEFIKYNYITTLQSRQELRQGQQSRPVEVCINIEDDAVRQFTPGEPARQRVLKETFDETAACVSDRGGFAPCRERPLGKDSPSLPEDPRRYRTLQTSSLGGGYVLPTTESTHLEPRRTRGNQSGRRVPLAQG